MSSAISKLRALSALGTLGVQGQKPASAVAQKIAEIEKTHGMSLPEQRMNAISGARVSFASGATLSMDNIRKHGNGEHFSYAEIKRIVALPIIGKMDEGELEEFNRETLLVEAFNAGFRLKPEQAMGLWTYMQYSGLFGPIGVGKGKTLLLLMIANAAYRKGKRKILLSPPPEVYSQLMISDIKWARARVPIQFPIHALGGMSLHQRVALVNSGKAGLYVLPHSLFSTKDTDTLLTQIAPEVVMVDEAHRFARRGAARTRRLLRLLDDRKPEVVAVSGTMTRKTIDDYYHIIRACLPKTCPLPLSTSLASEWGAVIDAKADVERTDATTGPLLPLVHWARQHFPDFTGGDNTAGFRAAYKRRLVTAPGVVASSDAEIGTSLILHNEMIPKEICEKTEGWHLLEELRRKIEEEWLTPNGDEIEHAIHTWKWMDELSAGFYNEMTWPTVQKLAERRRITETEAEDLMQRSKDHHEAQQEYHKALRQWLEREHKPGLDTPMLVGLEMARNGDKQVHPEVYAAWKAMRALDFEGRPERDTRAVRVCAYKINAAVHWAATVPKDKGAILWVRSIEVGEWLYDAMKTAGFDVVHCPAGANERMLDPGNGRRFIVASIKAHGIGKNLQHFEHQYIVQWPRGADIAEQLIGRTHRTGQQADELVVWTNHTLFFDELNFAACLNDALYIHQTTGSPQKLIYATYDPLPKIFPSAVLYERGLQNKMLTAVQQKMLTEKFGST